VLSFIYQKLTVYILHTPDNISRTYQERLLFF